MDFKHDFKHILQKYKSKQADKPKTNGIKFILACLLVGILGVGTVIFLKRSPGNDNPITAQAASEPAPPPTAINNNFITQINDCFMPVAKVYNYDLRITSGLRSIDEQNQIFEQGRTQDGHIVTDAPGGKSIHNYGYAVDVVDREAGYDIDWDKLERIANYCSIEEGNEGDWAHFENRGGLTTDQFAAGQRPPDLTLPCGIMKKKADSNKDLSLDDLQKCNAPDFNQYE